MRTSLQPAKGQKWKKIIACKNPTNRGHGVCKGSSPTFARPIWEKFHSYFEIRFLPRTTSSEPRMVTRFRIPFRSTSATWTILFVPPRIYLVGRSRSVRARRLNDEIFLTKLGMNYLGVPTRRLENLSKSFCRLEITLDFQQIFSCQLPATFSERWPP